MSDVTPRRRKRSASARLSAAGLAAMLAGCDDTADYRKQFGAPTEVAAFQSVNECVASGAYTTAQCTQASNEALQNDAGAAPRYASQNLCEDAFGSGQCLSRNEGGQSFFVPLPTGFMIGRLLDGGGYRYHGLSRSRRDDGITPRAARGSAAAAMAAGPGRIRWGRAPSPHPLCPPRPSASRRAVRSSPVAASGAARVRGGAGADSANDGSGPIDIRP